MLRTLTFLAALLPCLALAQTAPSPTFRGIYLQSPPTSTGPIGTMSSTATGGTTARTLAARAADVVNVRDFGAVCDGSTDDAAAINAALTRASTTRGEVFFPGSATACMVSTALNVPTGVSLRAAPNTVTLKATAGNASNPMLISVNGASNVTVAGLTLDGNSSANSAATSFNTNTIYNADNVVFDSVTIQNTRGIGLLFSQSVRSGVRNSVFSNVGMVGQTSGQFSDMRQGVAFCCGTLASNTGNFAINNRFDTIGLDAISATLQSDFRAEGNYCNAAGGTYYTPAGAACIYVANSTSAVAVGNYGIGVSGNGIDFYKVDVATITGNVMNGNGAAGIQLASSLSATIIGNVTNNNGQGGAPVQLSGGIALGGASGDPATLYLNVSGNIATDTQATKTQRYGLVTLTTTEVTYPWIDQSNWFDGNSTSSFYGVITGYTAAKISAQVSYIAQSGSSPNQGIQLLPTGTGPVMLGTHTGTSTTGNYPGNNALDLCFTRSAATQVASGASSVCLGGANNVVSGAFAFAQGQWMVADGTDSKAIGAFGSARFRPGLVLAFGQNATLGDAQAGVFVLRTRTTNTTATRLTGGGATGNQSPSNLNCINLPQVNFPTNQEAAYAFNIRLVATNTTTAGNFLSWFQPHAMLTRTTTLATTAYQGSTPVTLSTGTVGTVAAAADTTNGCLSLTWTAPNSDTWNVVARVDTVEAF